MNRWSRILLGIPLLLLPLTAHAISSSAACKYINVKHVSWNCEADNAFIWLIPAIASFLITIAGAAAVLFVAVGAFLMLVAGGDEGKAAKGKMAVIYALVGLGIALLSQMIVAYFVNQFGGLVSAGNPILAFIPMAVTAIMNLFNATLALMVIFAGFRMAFGHGSPEEFGKARNILVWALIGALVANFGRVLVEQVIAIL